MNDFDKINDINLRYICLSNFKNQTKLDYKSCIMLTKENKCIYYNLIKKRSDINCIYIDTSEANLNKTLVKLNNYV